MYSPVFCTLCLVLILIVCLHTIYVRGEVGLHLFFVVRAQDLISLLDKEINQKLALTKKIPWARYITNYIVKHQYIPVDHNVLVERAVPQLQWSKNPVP